MNQIVIFFVPTKATQRDFEVDLRGHIASRQTIEPLPQARADGAEIPDNDHLPLWTWFVPNDLS